jgi:hypothetical protein
MMNIAQLRVQHPMPWKYTTINGIVLVHDAAGKEVQLFTMLDFVCLVSTAMARAEASGG